MLNPPPFRQTTVKRIELSCKQEGARLVFIIFDNGYGIPPETLEKLNDLPHYTEGYGIKNVYQRLRLFCGDDVYLHFESEQGCFTKVTIKIQDGGNNQGKGEDIL